LAGGLRVFAGRKVSGLAGGDRPGGCPTGGVVSIEGRRMLVGCGDGSVELLEVQMEGKKRMDAAAFLNGNSMDKGERLG
jgi:methionyl-tRNA formyltransferase